MGASPGAIDAMRSAPGLALMIGLLTAAAACQQQAHARSTPGGGKPRPVPGLGPAEVVPSDLAGPEACADAPLLTLEQVARGERAGERIAFDVVPRAQVFCTAMACFGPDGEHDPDSCCNGCGGSYAVRIGDEFSLQFHGLDGCQGMDCNLHCEPFGREPTHTYRFVGVSEWSKRLVNGAIYDKSKFTVEKYCAVESP